MLPLLTHEYSRGLLYHLDYIVIMFFFSSRRRHTRWPRDWSSDVCSSDLVILVAGPGGHAHAVSRIGQACNLERVTTTGLIVGASAASETDLSRTLAQIRPWSLMVVLSRSDDYIDDMLTALRA